MSFDHRAHLALAVDSLASHGLAGAMARVPERLATLAEVHGQPHRYHHTLTVAWLLVLSDRMARSGHTTLGPLLDAYPELADPGHVHTLYAPGTLDREAARRHFLMPRPLGTA